MNKEDDPRTLSEAPYWQYDDGGNGVLARIAGAVHQAKQNETQNGRLRL